MAHFNAFRTSDKILCGASRGANTKLTVFVVHMSLLYARVNSIYRLQTSSSITQKIITAGLNVFERVKN